MYSKYVGIPFVPGGRDFAGVDCWGLIMLFYKDLGISIPDINATCETDRNMLQGTYEEALLFGQVVDRNVCPSIVTFKLLDPVYVNHVRIFIGGNKFIHARRKIGVSVDLLDKPLWRKKIEGYYIPKEG